MAKPKIGLKPKLLGEHLGERPLQHTRPQSSLAWGTGEHLGEDWEKGVMGEGALPQVMGEGALPHPRRRNLVIQ